MYKLKKMYPFKINVSFNLYSSKHHLNKFLINLLKRILKNLISPIDI